MRNMLVLLLLGCTTVNIRRIGITDPPIKSFVFLRIDAIAEKCDANSCTMMPIGTVIASGVVIQRIETDTHVMSARHFCEEHVVEQARIVGGISYTIKTRLSAQAHNGTKYNNVNVAYNDSASDLCIIHIKTDVNDRSFEQITIADKLPSIGDIVFNIAAPHGYINPGEVPIFMGIYAGIDKKTGYIFSSTATRPGTSGSMLVNGDGELFGIVIMMYARIEQMSISISLIDIRRVIAIHANTCMFHPNQNKTI